jgi:hypothetical protein
MWANDGAALPGWRSNITFGKYASGDGIQKDNQ